MGLLVDCDRFGIVHVKREVVGVSETVRVFAFRGMVNILPDTIRIAVFPNCNFLSPVQTCNIST